MIINANKSNINYFKLQKCRKTKLFCKHAWSILEKFDTTDEIEDVPSDCYKIRIIKYTAIIVVNKMIRKMKRKLFKTILNKAIKKLKIKLNKIMYTIKKMVIFGKEIQRNLGEPSGATLFQINQDQKNNGDNASFSEKAIELCINEELIAIVTK